MKIIVTKTGQDIMFNFFNKIKKPKFKNSKMQIGDRILWKGDYRTGRITDFYGNPNLVNIKLDDGEEIKGVHYKWIKVIRQKKYNHPHTNIFK